MVDIKDILDLTEAVEAHVVADPGLGYIDYKQRGYYDREHFPKFEKYAVVVSPVAFQGKNVYYNGGNQQTTDLDVVCLLKKTGDMSDFEAVFGRIEVEGKIGVIKMTLDVYSSLANFIELNKSRLDINKDEMEGKLHLNKPKLRETVGLYYEVTIPLKIRLKHQ